VTRTISLIRTRGIPLTPPAERFLGMVREAYSLDRPPPNSNLPVAESALIGREAEANELRGLIRPGSIVTLTGPGGSGKTRLAVHVAANLVDEFPDGVYLVDLSPLRDPGLVSASLAATLVLKDPEELATRLEGRHLLVVLDNFEHLLDAAKEVAELSRSAPTVAFLATSRVPLGIPRERRYRVEPLALDDAAKLFLDRAREVNPRFADGAPVRRICARLDRLPLALELAAARARGTTPSRLADRLEEQLPELAGRRNAPARQRTLTATIAWSYDLLNDDQRQLLARLAVFRGGWTVAAADQVCAADAGDLAVLAEAGLVRTSGERSSMLETVRQFADARLAESGELDSVRRRHAEHMLELAREARQHARSLEEKPMLDRLELELDNLRAAFGYALEHDAGLGLVLAEALEPLWIRGMHQREAVRRLEPLLRLEADVEPAIRAGALSLAGRAAIESGEIEKAEPWFRAGLDLARESGDELQTAWALHGLGHLLAEQGDTSSARALFEESMELFLRLGEHAPAGGRMTYLAYYAARDGDLVAARDLLERATEEYRLAGDLAGVSGCIHSLGDLALDAGDVDGALERYLEAQPLMLQAGSVLELESILAGLAAVAALRGRSETAALLWGAFERLDADAERKLEADDRARYERQLGGLDAAQVDEGRALSDEEAVALAREVAVSLGSR
jgi:predicted ATPase